MAQDEKCPVDHSTREAWLRKTKAAPHPVPEDSSETCPVDHSAREVWMKKTVMVPEEAIEVRADTTGCSGRESSSEQINSNVNLPQEREISSIPRTGGEGNWIYPSQKQFFDAMKRKKWEPQEQDMNTVVPIHNAVNERAWQHIQMWEKGFGGEKCGGVKLTSFQGDSKKLTPRARWKLFLGYERPFDRHDWKVNRCGKEVEYVIDFYSGKSNPNTPQVPSFYLDVRPKLNTLEGIKMRVWKSFGW